MRNVTYDAGNEIPDKTCRNHVVGGLKNIIAAVELAECIDCVSTGPVGRQV